MKLCHRIFWVCVSFLELWKSYLRCSFEILQWYLKDIYLFVWQISFNYPVYLICYWIQKLGTFFSSHPIQREEGGGKMHQKRNTPHMSNCHNEIMTDIEDTPNGQFHMPFTTNWRLEWGPLNELRAIYTESYVRGHIGCKHTLSDLYLLASVLGGKSNISLLINIFL